MPSIGQGGGPQRARQLGRRRGRVLVIDGQVVVDRQPSDATAVTTTVLWSNPRSGQVVQRAVVSGPRVATP